MTDTTTEKDSTETVPKASRYMSSLEFEQLLREIAVGHPFWVLASRYGKSYQHIKNVSHQNKERIAEIKRELGEEMNILWAQDLTYRAMELQTSIEKTRQQQRVLEKEAAQFNEGAAVSEHWHKLDAHAAKLIHQLGEMLGQLPTRSPAVSTGHGKASIEIVGVDLEGTAKEWEQAAG